MEKDMTVFGKIINLLSTYLIYALILVLPLAFTNLTTEYFETAKLIFLGAVSLLLLLLWAARAYVDSKLVIVKTPLDILFLLFLIVAVLSTVLSPTPYPALFGLLPKVHGSLIFIVALVLTFFMITSNIGSRKQLQTMLILLVTSGVVLSLVSLLSYFQIFLPWESAQITNYSLAGSSTSAAVFLTIILPLALSLALSQKTLSRFDPLSLLGLIAGILFTITIILIGNLGVWLGALLALALSVFYLRPQKDQLAILGVLGVIGIAIAILSYTPTVKDKTELGKLAGSFQRDIQLDLLSSWKISAKTFSDSPILGTGPGTYLYNFTQYKPLEVNRGDLWNKKIGSAHNQYLQTWAELGGAGVLLLILISGSFVFITIKNIKEADFYISSEARNSSSAYILGLALSAITFTLVMATSPMSVLTQSTGVILMGLFLATLRGRHHQVRLMEANLSTAYGGSVHPLIPSLVFVPVLILGVVGFFYLGKLTLGEYYHRLSLNATSKNQPREAYNLLIRAEQKNPQIDLYRVDLAEINFTLANGIAASRGPTEASPGGSLTSEDRQNIQQLLQQSIAEGRTATTLAQRSSANWQVLANIYRQLSGVAQNAIPFALNSYGRAIQQDPLNPQLRFAVGNLYYQQKNYDLAVRFFDDSVALKPDFTTGLYNLAVALRDKGNTDDAIKVTENLVAKLQDKPQSEDYKRAAALLAELKEKASLTTPTSPTIPTSPLEQSLIPKVDIGQPEKVATPPAVQP